MAPFVRTSQSFRKSPRRSPMSRSASVMLCVFSSALAVACGSDSGSSAARTPSPQKQSPQEQTPNVDRQSSAVSDAYASLTAGARDKVVQVIQDVDALAADEPDNGRAVFYSGVMRLWQLGEKLD